MDRTNEFKNIVQSTDIPQNNFNINNFGIDIYNKDLKIKKIIEKIDKTSIYEKHKIIPLLEEFNKLISDFSNIKISLNFNNEKIKENIKNIMKIKLLEYKLLKSKIERKIKKNKIAQNETIRNETMRNEIRRNDQNQLIQEYEQKNESKTEKITNEKILQRKRIVSSITEIGQIVEDINLHVNLQEEQLKRIDDITFETNNFSKNGLKDLLEIWELVSDKRKTIFKFFGFWILLILIFYFIKR